PHQAQGGPTYVDDKLFVVGEAYLQGRHPDELLGGDQGALSRGRETDPDRTGDGHAAGERRQPLDEVGLLGAEVEGELETRLRGVDERDSLGKGLELLSETLGGIEHRDPHAGSNAEQLGQGERAHRVTAKDENSPVAGAVCRSTESTCAPWGPLWHH